MRSYSLFLAGMLLSTSVQAQSVRLDFEGFYQRALEHSSQIKESKAALEYSEARKALSTALMYPKLQWEAVAGPSPNYTGNALQSNTNYDSWGVAFQSKVELIQPLYTFGALGKLREAAQMAHEAEEGRHKREEALLRQNIAHLYYGYQLAFELREVTRDLLAQLRNAQTEGEKLRRNKHRSAPSLTDLERLNVYVAELEARFEEAQKFLDLARLGMNVEIIPAEGEEFRWNRANLKRREGEVQELSVYLDKARSYRPEYDALRKEIAAREALADAEKARQYPVLFAGARWNYAHNTASENQNSVFANDPFNQNNVMVGLGVKWDLFSMEQKARASMAKAEMIQARAKNESLLVKLDAELEKNWRELSFLSKAVDQRDLSLKSARAVYRDMLGGFALGTTVAKDLLESMGALAMAQKSYYETLFEEHMAWVRLESISGPSAELTTH